MASNWSRSNSGPLKSLQDLCKKRALDHILKSADFDFASLEPRLQQILFREVQTEVVRLKDIESNWTDLSRSCPKQDIEIYLGGTQRDVEAEPEDFSDKWEYISSDEGFYGGQGEFAF